MFPVWTLKSVKSTFGMEYDQRVIIRFLWNEGSDARDIAERLQTDFSHNLMNMLINFKRFDSGLQRHGSVVKICMMKFTPEDLHLMILTRKFCLY
jgi:hypothetical protein